MHNLNSIIEWLDSQHRELMHILSFDSDFREGWGDRDYPTRYSSARDALISLKAIAQLASQYLNAGDSVEDEKDKYRVRQLRSELEEALSSGVINDD